MANLIDDFGCFQVAFEPRASGQAELAPERTPGLARHAKSTPRRFAYEHRFDEIAVMEAKQVLTGPVRRFVDPADRKSVEGRSGLDPGPKRPAKVRALVPRGDVSRIEVPEYLPGAKGFFAEGGNPRFELLRSVILQALAPGIQCLAAHSFTLRFSHCTIHFLK
jgi:hypothetical protein